MDQLATLQSKKTMRLIPQVHYTLTPLPQPPAPREQPETPCKPHGTLPLQALAVSSSVLLFLLKKLDKARFH